MKAIDKDLRIELSHLFHSYQWNYLPDAILEGHMGDAFVDDEDNPQIAELKASKIGLSVIGGDAKHPSAHKYIEQLSAPKAMIFSSEGWEGMMREIQHGRLIIMPRYAFTSEKLDIAHLHQLKSQIPDGYRLEQMEIKLAQQLASERSQFASNHMVNFDSPEDFVARGFGFCLLKNDEIVSVATTFAICSKGIEIQINTRENRRGKGLATVVAAQLLIYSLMKNLDPNWDAGNKVSVGLAKKLGYTPQGTYSVFILVNSRLKAALGNTALKITERLGK